MANQISSFLDFAAAELEHTRAYLAVEDDGTGFDAEEINEAHTTLTNIRQRLEWMCGGKMEITPRDGGGTMITVTIPDPEA